VVQLILLDSLYAVSGTECIFFQGGTALRWIHGGMRFSEDLDFVTPLAARDIDAILKKVFSRVGNACIAQFGTGQSEQVRKSSRGDAVKIFFIYRPQAQRERIAVKLEFETLLEDRLPEVHKYVMRDLPLVAGMVNRGALILPYSSSIVVAESPDELLSDKIRALYERPYLKGRDIYDIWWLTEQMRVAPSWKRVKNKLGMYRGGFIPVRSAGFFLDEASRPAIIGAVASDVPRFIPPSIAAVYRENGFKVLLDALQRVISALIDQGLNDKALGYAGR
jgi:predicted nucleotidyltransferase component of viral defense system